MGSTVIVKERSGPYPHSIEMTVTCDMADCEATATQDGDWMPDNITALIRKGWKYVPGNAETWLCPEHSGKATS